VAIRKPHPPNFEKGIDSMANVTLRQTRRGDERLIQACLLVDRLCSERLSATERLEAHLGRADAQRLTNLLSSRGITLRDTARRPYASARRLAAA
jgi:hypothetical protein